MCIAIFKAEKKRISKASLEMSFMNNPDGAGFAFANGGRVHIRKGYMTFADFWEVYSHKQHLPCAIHFRLSTHGGVSKINCHPFRISEGVAMIHNGVIPDQKTDSKTSDTRAFVRDIAQPAYQHSWKFLYSQYGQKLLSSIIGKSKLVFLNRRGRAVIINEKKGHWSKGVWYSNDTYKRERGFKVKQTKPLRGLSSTSTATSNDILGYHNRTPKGWVPKDYHETCGLSPNDLHYEPEVDQLEELLSQEADGHLEQAQESYAKRRYDKQMIAKGFSIMDEDGNEVEEEYPEDIRDGMKEFQ